MANEFITNQDRLLVDVMNNILPSANRLHFLVGYFYFSGFEEIYKNIGDKEVKILVGLEVETDLANKIREFERISTIEIPRGQIRANYYNSLIRIFNDTDYFDTKERQEAFKLFLGKIENGTLEIKKTHEPNHAKLYIFENKDDFNQGGEFPGTTITGSSNLTRAGLRHQFEVNVISRDKSNYADAKKIFDTLWQKAIAIVDKDYIKEFFQEVVEKIWIDKLPSPYLIYIRVLEEYFSQYSKDFLRLPREITDGKYINLKYQTDAIARALDIIKKHNGVIVADVVGLGKSIIASAVAHNLNLKAIVIAPPHLKPQWEDYHNEFEFHARIYSSGKIDEALEENSYDGEKLIIIDEAHKYRNELTADYANLHKLCQGNKVMLLSATPFNNRPQDVFSMVKLFQIPARSTLQTVDNLSFQFRELILEYKKIKEMQKDKKESKEAIQARIKDVAHRIREILYPLVIRRSRLDLEAIEEYREDLKKQKISFPKVHPPKLLDYELGALTKLYKETLDQIAPETNEMSGFVGARYMPVNYIDPKYRKKIAQEMGIDENLLNQTQINLAKFMRRLLVRRFESSVYSFKTTLESIIESSETICEWYKRVGKVPIYKKGRLPDIDELEESTGDDADEELKEITLEEQLKKYNEKGMWFIDKDELSSKFNEILEKDIAILRKIHVKWFGKGLPKDPKIEHFLEIIQEKIKEYPQRKIVVFTEFADTAEYLYREIKDKIRTFKYSSADASEANKRIIKENFDAGYKIQKNDYDILIATDAISEGFNLHKAGIVFNYDIPYNPTRVIQRVGRINRINKKVYDELFIYNFFPTATGEEEARVKEIATLKIAMIHALFGEDTKVLTKDEELQSFFKERYNEALSDQEELSPEAKYENIIKKLRISNPELVSESLKIPRRIRIRRTVKKDRSGVVVFGKKGSEYAFKLCDKNNATASLGIADAMKLFEAESAENADKVSESFESIYEDLKKKLFSKRTEVALDQGKRETIIKIRALKDKVPHKKDYLESLLIILEKLDALPDRYAKFIRGIDLKDLDIAIKELERLVPHRYLLGVIKREQEIEEGGEALILSEELI